MDRPACGMRHAVGIVCRAACRMRNQPLESAVYLAVRIPDRPLYLHESLRKLGLALHRENAVGHKPQRLEERIEFLLHLRSRLWRQRIKPLRFRYSVHARAYITFCSSSNSPPVTAILARKPFCMPMRFIGSSMSQKRRRSSEARTVKTMRQSAPIAGCQLISNSAQPTASSAIPTQKVTRGSGALKNVRRLTWSSMWWLDRLRTQTITKNATISRRPIVSMIEASFG